ncbi:uncharacterized protein M421DRAFT_102157 [Didymella exigua CBS 183.55]|uniref:Uncharacterized protein n=1 Tax=Didymella exigua CBS 183.55 TaxID=1150837 RepID=A0A6A5REN7_9PLEO|nr:uncharacterized protein M421DRAFT_102157 [Didymella exigua CBS 183.55]KAF1926725.1 hypothetical protein M421DRAFT_102157 [Didymella exigua CBS 183.55]
MDSWMELAKVGTIKFLMTIFLGGALCLCLKSWEGFHKPVALSKHDVQIFNALTIALSICLGLNLLTSLKRYAIFLRWAIITRYWVPIEIFDLILGIDELTNVAKLLVLSTPALEHKWLLGRSRPWRNSHPGCRRKFAIACFIWLLINIGSQVLVASISLFWPMESYKCPLTEYGSVAVADLSKWDKAEAGSTVHSSREAAWRFGLEAQSWSNFPVAEKAPDLSQLPGTPIYKGEDSFEYRFYYRNPERLYSDYLPSNRIMKACATCKQYQILSMASGSPSPGLPETLFAKAKFLEENTNVSIPLYGEGMVLWQAIVGETCGARCTQLIVFQKNGSNTLTAKSVNKDSLWICENEVTNISTTGFGTSHFGISTTDTAIYGTDTFAKLAAGAIGWTGYSQGKWLDRQWRLYTQDSPWSPKHVLNTHDVEEIIMRFSIGAIAAFDNHALAAFDDHGVRHQIKTNELVCPKDSQQLNVDWLHILGILGSICAIQLASLIGLIVFANRAIIRDTSCLSTAVLLRPVLLYRRIKYGYRENADGMPYKIAVFFQGRDPSEIPPEWASGRYR